MSTLADSSPVNLASRFTYGAPTLASQEPWGGRFHRHMSLAAIGAILISLYGHFVCKLTTSMSDMMPTFFLLVAVFAGAAQYRWRKEEKCFNLVMMVFWVIVITNFHFFPMYMAARQNVPMSDASLASMDRMLGLEVPTVLSFLKPYPSFNRFMLTIYGTLIPLMTIATILPPLLNRMDKAKEFAIACIVAASIAMPIFACFQAVGPWHHYDFTPALPSLSAKASMLETLKSEGWYHIDLSNRDGLITFPSFHVVLTVLAAVALWPIRYLRWISTVWAALIVASTVTTGIHYSIDVVGGFAVAIVSLVVARIYVRWDASYNVISADE